MGKLLSEWTRQRDENAKCALTRLREQRLSESMAIVDHCLGHEYVTHQADALRSIASVYH